MTDYRIADIPNIRKYIFGCKNRAIFTLQFHKTGHRFTYRVRRCNPRLKKNFVFADVLVGPENESDYIFIGTLFDEPAPRGRFRIFHHSPKSRLDDRNSAVIALDWFIARINYKKPLDSKKIEFYHSGLCSRCGRLLTTPESLACGMGPKCAKHAAGGF